MITKTLRHEQDAYPIHNVRVVDGDTLHARILLPFDTWAQEKIRLKGWWADEPNGLYREQGIEAGFRLEKYCKDKVLWIVARGQRRDKYGRVIAHLMHENQIVNPKDVLGEYQLTEAVHALHRAQTQSQAGRGIPPRSLPAVAPDPAGARGMGIYEDGPLPDPNC